MVYTGAGRRRSSAVAWLFHHEPGRLLRISLALLSAGAAVIHFSVAGGHFDVSWAHGAFFVTIAWLQAVCAAVVLYRPSRLLLLAGATVNLAVIATWIVSRTVGVPVGPTAGLPELVHFEDALATAFEAGFVGLSIAALRWKVLTRTAPSALLSAATLILAPVVVVLTSAALVSASHEGGHHAMPGGARMAGAAHDGHASSGDPTAVASGSHHAATSIPEDDPVLVELKAAVADGGTTVALDRLEQLAAEDEGVRALAHQYVHSLGRYVYSYYGDAGEAFASCDQRFESGCYHGVLQGYFEANPDFTGTDLAGLCGGPIDAGAIRNNLKFQCIHGLGHGLSLFYDHALLKPLRFCDFLETAWDRKSCYGGVFMENIVFTMSPLGQGTQGESLIKEDPHYPCNAVADKYKMDCYFLQSSAILFLNGYKFDAAFAECDNAPEPYIEACYMSMGRDIGGYTQQDPQQSLELCTRGDPTYRKYCFDGVVKNLIGFNWDIEMGLEFCGEVPMDSKKTCYRGVGEMVTSLSSDRHRAAECAQAGDERWVSVCRFYAGLSR